MGNRGAKKFDPAQCASALRKQQELIKTVPITALRHTHDVVSDHFTHGNHKGHPVRQLTDDLLSGRTTVDRITPLVVVLLDKVHWVVFGNRRLKALKDFQSRGPLGALL